ncbi:ABC transporter substrate-binding protein [Chengkuizengella marina]|uniref:ABC transporter substrate-binding protein n=1 Tax=Chengkuizengella marina TaxID=2507566 RepID=A0A6N9Q2R3_9BACL|nr:ABC transporter substrate-binding protein [Chengkuizengella marina]NBI29008.1 ABC transporter substrate-binding protein [Chengkuizengella marina]
MKKISVVLIAVLMVFALAACGSNPSDDQPETNDTNGEATNDSSSDSDGTTSNEEQKVVKVGIAQLIEHPSLDLTREGFIQALEDAGYEDGTNLELDYQNAQGEMPNNTTIAQKFEASDNDLILAITTPTAQVMKQEVKNIPVLFTAVTDPLGAGLVNESNDPVGNVTGMSDTHPSGLEELMNFVAKEFSDVKSLGVVYNAGEQNSSVSVERAKTKAEELGIAMVEANITNTSELKQATESLLGKVDALFIPKDNMVVSGLPALLQVANENDLPVFASEKDTVASGAFVSFSVDYFTIGYETGQMALEIIDGEKSPEELAIRYPDKLDLVINLKAAEEQGITVSEELLKQVKEENIIKE